MSEREDSELSKAIVCNEIVYRSRPNDDSAFRDMEAIFAKLNEFLINTKKVDRDRVNQWMVWFWESQCSDVFKAYINILELWGYPYEWRQIVDTRGRPAILVLHEGEPAACIGESEIRFVSGRPHRFSVDIGGGSWHFDFAEPQLVINAKGPVDADPESEYVWQKTVIGQRRPMH